MKIKRFLPFLDWMPSYELDAFKSDLIAGLTVGVMFIPQSMAYALLAGLPPIYGLYAGLFPMFMYGLLGTSSQLSVGPVAISALLVLASVSQIADPGTTMYIEYALLAGLLIGIMELMLCFLRFGFLVNFLSHPVINGFTMAAAVIIAISQLKAILAIPIPRFHYTYETIWHVTHHLTEANWISVLMCLSSMMVMIVLKRINKYLPGALIVVAFTTFLTWILSLESYGLQVVGEIPRGLPSFSFPTFTFERAYQLLPTVLVVTTIGFVESISIAKMLEVKNRGRRVNPDQELFALGIGKILGALFQAMPSSGSFSRSAVIDSAGGKTGVSSMITTVLVGITLLFLTDWFYYTPLTVLAAIILLAVRRIFNYREAIHLWRTHRRDFWVLSMTFLITLFAGIEIGVFSGVLISIFIVLYRSSKPHYAVLGRVSGTSYYRNSLRHPKVEVLPEVLIFRFDDQLYYANATYFRDRLLEQLKMRPETEHLVLECSNMHDLDSTGVKVLEEVHDILSNDGIQLRIANLPDRVEDIFNKSGLMKRLKFENYFVNVDQAVVQIELER